MVEHEARVAQPLTSFDQENSNYTQPRQQVLLPSSNMSDAGSVDIDSLRSLEYSSTSSIRNLPEAQSMRNLHKSSAREHHMSFLSSTPIEEFVTKYQVIKCSWRGKYERIFALAPTRFCTIDPKDFEVTNTWSLKALRGINLEQGDPEGFTLILKGPKKDEQLKLRCRFRSRLLSDIYLLQDQFLQRRSKMDIQFSCKKWLRNDTLLDCRMDVGLDGLVCTYPDGSMRSKYLYVEMEHLTMLSDSKDGFALGYSGRSRLFFSEQRTQIMHRIIAAAEAIGCFIRANSNATAPMVKKERLDYGSHLSNAFVQFPVQKITPKHNEPVNRVLSLHEKCLAELGKDGGVIACYEYRKIYVLIRHPKTTTQFEIQFVNGEIRKYASNDRDGALAAIYDVCVTCNENPEIFISCVANERGSRLLPFFATEDASETHSFFGDSSIGTCFLQRMTAVGKFDRSRKLTDKSFLGIVEEFNANVPASGIIYNTKQSIITDALRPIGAQLYYLSKSKPLPSRSAVTLLQALFRIASSYYGFREIGQIGQISDSITNLLVNGDEFAVFWTTLLLRRLTAHVIPSTTRLDPSSVTFCEEVETYNKSMLFGNTYLVYSLMSHLDGIEVERKPHTSRTRRVGPLVIMGLLQTLEGCLCSRKTTTPPAEFHQLVAEVAKYYSTLLKLLFQSRSATTVEACTLLLKTTLEECDPTVAARIRNAALTEGIVLRHFYQAIFDESYDQRCVSRYLVSLWMSHHDSSQQLLSRMIPIGFLSFLRDPISSAAEITEMERREREEFGMESEDLHEHNSVERLSSSSGSSFDVDVRRSSMSVADMDKIDEADTTMELFIRRSQSSSVINERPPGYRPETRRLSESEATENGSRASIIGGRSSVSWISTTVRESFHTQIENEYTKARMLQKLKSSVNGHSNRSTMTSATSSRRSDNGRQGNIRDSTSSDGNQRVRKRDAAMEALSHAFSKVKSDKPLTRRKRPVSYEKVTHVSRHGHKQENFRLLFYNLTRDHESVDLIWNKSTREELRRALFGEIQQFSSYQNNHEDGAALWNYEDFRVIYSTLADEIVLNGSYIRLLSEHIELHKRSDDQDHTVEDNFVPLTQEQVSIRDPRGLLAALYRRVLRENIRAEHHNDLATSILCLKSMVVVGTAYADYAGSTDFDEIDYLTTLMAETVHAAILESVHQVVRALCLYGPNARRFHGNSQSITITVRLLQLAHISDRQGDDSASSTKLWLLEDEEGETFGPLSVQQLQYMKKQGKINMSTLWVRRCDDDGSGCVKPNSRLMENAQLRWEVGIQGELHPLQIAHDAINILLAAARSSSLMKTANTEESIGPIAIFPPPRGKSTLWSFVPNIVPVLLRFNYPKLCEKVAALLEFLYTDNLPILHSKKEDVTNRPRLFSLGLFYMVFLGDTTEFESIASLIKSTHKFQDGFDGASALTGILPEAMIDFLEHSSATTFADVFCGQLQTAQVIWNRNMRMHLRDACIAHMKEYMEILEEDITSDWSFCLMAPVNYEDLKEELWCGGVYLGKFCEDPDVIINDPLDFMGVLTRGLRDEFNREGAQLNFTQAAEYLDVPAILSKENDYVARAGFKEKARALCNERLPSEDYAQRLQILKEAYRVLSCPRPSLLTKGHDPVNLILLLHSLVLMCNRYPSELGAHEFDCYDLLLSLLVSHCSAEGVPPLETSKEQVLEISVCCAELLHNTCAVSYRNGDLLLNQPDLMSLEKVVRYCVDSIIHDNPENHNPLLEVCFFVFQTITGLVASHKGRTWILGSSTLVVDMVRVLWYWNHTTTKSFLLSKITQQVLEGISRMSLLEENQDRLLQSGVLWQLFLLFSQYNVELDDTTVRSRLQASLTSVNEDFSKLTNEVENLLAIMAIRALCRLGGFFVDGSELASPKHPRVKSVTDALLTPNLSDLLILSSHHEYLKIFHGECESYTLFWNESMRQELLTFITLKCAVEPSDSLTMEDYADAIRFRFEYLADIFCVGDIYVETLMGSLFVIERSGEETTHYELGLGDRFFKYLFSFIDTGELELPVFVDSNENINKLPPHSGWRIDQEELRTVDRVTALNCLAIVTSVVPEVVESNLVRDIGALKMVLRLLFPPDNEVHQSEDAEQSLILPTQLYMPCRHHCIAILEIVSRLEHFAKASLSIGICDILIELVHVVRDVAADAIKLIQNLCGHGAQAEVVAEILQSGCYLEFIGWLLVVEDYSTPEELNVAESLRVPTARVLAEMMKEDTPMGLEARRAVSDFFPVAMVYELADSPSTFVEFYLADHANPELVWNDNFRMHLRNNVINFLNLYYSSATSIAGSENGQFASIVDKFRVDYSLVYPLPMTGNVYLQLYMNNPVYKLRDPLYFATCLWEEFDILFQELAHITSALRQTIGPDDDVTAQRDIELVDLVASALSCLFQVYPWLLEHMAEANIPERCCEFLNESVRNQSNEACTVNVIRLLRVMSQSTSCIAALEPSISTVFTNLMAVINPALGKELHFEAAYVLEIMRRIILHYSNHGERDPSSGIVFVASRLDLFGYLLNILDNPSTLGDIKEPLLARAEAIEILNLLEKDRFQSSTAYNLLKKHKKWEKKYKFEPTQIVHTHATEDPFLQRSFPGAEQKVRDYVANNLHIDEAPPRKTTHLGNTRGERSSSIQQYRDSPRNTDLNQPQPGTITEKTKSYEYRNRFR